jgi:hypothetical protein
MLMALKVSKQIMADWNVYEAASEIDVGLCNIYIYTHARAHIAEIFFLLVELKFYTNIFFYFNKEII